MPGLTRATFIDTVDAMLDQTIDALVRQGTVYERLHGFDRRGPSTTFIGLAPAEVAAWNSDKAIALVSPLGDHVERIAEEFRAHRVHAAIHVGEAWYTSAQAPTFTELFQRLDEARKAPGRIEMVFANGFWPREYLTRTRQAAIQRDAAGRPTGAKEITLEAPDEIGLGRMSWVNDTLPQPPRR